MDPTSLHNTSHYTQHSSYQRMIFNDEGSCRNISVDRFPSVKVTVSSSEHHEVPALLLWRRSKRERSIRRCNDGTWNRQMPCIRWIRLWIWKRWLPRQVSSCLEKGQKTELQITATMLADFSFIPCKSFWISVLDSAYSQHLIEFQITEFHASRHHVFSKQQAILSFCFIWFLVCAARSSMKNRRGDLQFGLLTFLKATWNLNWKSSFPYP